ncbi:MAG: BlaI/MecI/CopY family transcriptional regulator [Sedimentisphaerales bacterium]|nr:BlaI/MecI/CopY family transcriptional regulator [Sedimentisphaerales bacterium]
MTPKSLDDLGELQRAVLETVWEMEEANVHQVRKQLGCRRKLAYTTVLSAMQKLEKAGWLRHRAEGKTYVYVPTQTREQAGAGSLRGFLQRVFAGDAVAMFQHLIRESNLSDEDLGELRRMIDKKRKERQS